MHNYQLNKKIGEGSFSEVYWATNLLNRQEVAIKLLKIKFESSSEAYKTPEIKNLQRLYPHPNIIQLIEIIYTKKKSNSGGGNLALVFELMEMNLCQALNENKSKF